MKKIQILKAILLIFISNQIIFSQKKDMSIIDFLNIPGISSVSLSPNGNKIVYILSESDWKENKQIPNLENESSRISGDTLIGKKIDDQPSDTIPNQIKNQLKNINQIKSILLDQ